MPLLKLYGNTNPNSNINYNNLKLNERIITPNSIPIFILPPTLESCRKNSANSKFLSYSTQNVNKIQNQIHTSTSLHDLKNETININKRSPNMNTNTNNNNKTLSATLIDSLIKTNELSANSNNNNNNNRKSHSLPFVTFNNTSTNINSLTNKTKTKKKSKSLFHNGILNLLNFNVSTSDDNDASDSNNNDCVTFDNDYSIASSNSANQQNNRLNVNNYLTIDTNGTDFLSPKSLENNNKLFANNSSKPLTLQTSRSSLGNIDINSNKLVSYLSPTLTTKTNLPYQKTRSKSETLINVPQLLLLSNISSTNSTNQNGSAANRKRLSYQAQNSLIKMLNANTNASNNNNSQLKPQTQQQNFKFSLRNLFKLNHSDQQQQHSQIPKTRSQSMKQSSIDTIVPPNPLFTRFSISSAKTSLFNYTFGVKDSNTDDNLSNDNTTDTFHDYDLSDNKKSETTTNTIEQPHQHHHHHHHHHQTSTSKTKLNIFHLLLNHTKKLSNEHRTLSSTILCKTDESNKTLIDRSNDDIGSFDRQTKFKRNNSLSASFLSKFKYKKSNENGKNNEFFKETLNGYIDLKIEFDAQSNEINVLMSNINIKPLIEMNKIKAKMTYICTIDKDSLLSYQQLSQHNDENYLHHNSNANSNLSYKKHKKIKFNANMRNKITKLKFSLFKKAIKNMNNNDYLILNTFRFDIEIHSYLPLSRKLLNSTFRNSKRVFKGQLVIENIELNNLNNLSFMQKEFKLCEI